eukprot:scaffold32280_cov118-Skeletonema_marinoi.AAC.1
MKLLLNGYCVGGRRDADGTTVAVSAADFCLCSLYWDADCCWATEEAGDAACGADPLEDVRVDTMKQRRNIQNLTVFCSIELGCDWIK